MLGNWNFGYPLLLVLLFSIVSCLYEDQAGLFDWRQRYFGDVKQLDFIQLCTNSKASNCKRDLVVASDARYGLVNAMDGSMTWHVETHSPIVGISAVDDKLVVVTEAEIDIFYIYGDSKLGFSYGSFPLTSRATFVRSIDNGGVVLATERSLCQVDLEKSDISCPHMYTTIHSFDLRRRADGADMLVTHVTDGKKQFLLELNENLIEEKRTELISNKNSLSCDYAQDNKLYCIDMVTMEGFFLSDGSKTKFRNKIQGKISNFDIVGSVAYIRSDRGALCQLRLDTFDTACSNSHFFGIYGDGNFYFAEMDEKSMKLNLKIISKTSPNDGKLIVVADMPIGEEKIDKLLLCRYSSTPYLAVKTSMLSVHLIDTKERSSGQFLAKELFRRNEALGEIVSAVAVDYPLSHTQGNIEHEFEVEGLDPIRMFFKRIKYEIEMLYDLADDLYVQYYLAYQGSDSRNRFKYRDTFSLNKIIVVATSVGKVFALDSSTGEILWQIVAKKSCLPNQYPRLQLLRTTDHFGEPPVLVVHDLRCFVTIDPVEGVERTAEVIDGVKMVRKFGLTNDESHISPLLLVKNDLTIRVLPKSEEDFVAGQKLNDFYTFEQADARKLSGFRLDFGGMKSMKQWEFTVPADYRLIRAKGKAVSEVTHSKGIVLADRTVLFKYLNPNLIAVVAVGDGVTQEHTNVYFIDGVTGNSIGSVFTIKHAVEPIDIVHVENWFAMHYRNSNYRRTEVAVWEMFQGKEEWNGTVFSSYHAYKEPLIMKQQYVLSTMVKAMGVTQTARAIAQKAVLLATSSGHIVVLPKALLNPRRMLYPPPEHMEEGVAPYHPELPLIDWNKLNYNQTVSVSCIETFPTALESTALVFAYGKDLYLTRVAPSDMFDMLKEGFDYNFIAILVIGLLVATFVMQKVVAKREFDKIWR